MRLGILRISMRHVLRNRSIRIGTTIGVALLTIGLSGCTATSSPPTASSTGVPTTLATPPSSAPAQKKPVDHSRLLIEPGDIDGAGDTFVARSTVPNRRGTDAASALFVNQDDTRAISVTILVLPDPAAAASTLQTSIDSVGGVVTGARPQPSSVGTGGTVVAGAAPDGSKDVTVLMFTEGPAVARIEFGSVAGEPTPAQVVTDVGTKQEIALRTGLADPTG